MSIGYCDTCRESKVGKWVAAKGFTRKTEYWAKKAVQACMAHSAHYSTSCVIHFASTRSQIVTIIVLEYTLEYEHNIW